MRHPGARQAVPVAQRQGSGLGTAGRPPKRRRTDAQIRRTAADNQSSSLWAHRNWRARMARPSGMTTRLVPGTGTTRRATPKVRTLNPAMATATLRSPEAAAVPGRAPGPTRLFAVSRRRIRIAASLIALVQPSRRHSSVMTPTERRKIGRHQGAFGRVTSKLVPASQDDWTDSFPWCAAMIRSEI